jgi:hypothetical protein
MRRTRSALLAAALAGLTLTAVALPPNSPAPGFHGTDSTGKAQSLSQYRGKWVVLEWANSGCPYDRKHYESGSIEALQHQWTAKGVVWLSVISSAPGQQGYVTPAEEAAYLKQKNAAPTAVLLDPQGAIGHLYDARTTPHVFLIDPSGTIVYQGALDNQPSPDPATLKGADNYLADALSASLAGKPVSVAITRPYGCSVKYAQ